MIYHGVKSGRDSSKGKSDICCLDTYLAISDLFKLCKEISYILVITGSSFSPVCVSDEEEGT
jgi:hypothetical protein